MPTNVGQFCQSQISLALQRTYLAELFVPCVSGNLLVMKKTKTLLEKGGIIKRVLLSLQKSGAYWEASSPASKTKDSLIFWMPWQWFQLSITCIASQLETAAAVWLICCPMHFLDYEVDLEG